MPPASVFHRLKARIAGEGIGPVLVRGATGSAGAHLTGAALALLAQLALARFLGISHYGYYVYAFAWIMILAQLCRLGFQNSLIRFTASYRTTRDWPGLLGLVRRGSQSVLAAAVMAALGLAGIAWMLSGKMPAAQFHTFAIAALVVIPLALLGVAQGLLRGYRRPARALLPFRTFIHGGTLLLVLLVGATVGLDSAPVAMGLTLLAATASLAIAWLWVRQALAPDIAGAAPDYRTRLWLRASLPLLLMEGMSILMKQADTAMLGALVGTDQAGLYFPVARMSELAAFGLMSANAIVAPMIAELHTAGDRERLQRLLTLAAIGTSAVTVAAALAFWLLGAWALGLFGPEFPAAWPALMILLGGQMVNALCGPVGLLMTMTGHQDRAATVLVCAAILNVGLNAVLIPPFGLMGAAVATAISTAAWNLGLLVAVWRTHRLNPSIFARWPRVRV